MESLVVAQGISKAFVANPLFHDVNFTLEVGEKVGLIGHNGCGKSTLFNIIRGLTPVDIGEIRRKEDLRFGVLGQYQTQDSNETLGVHLNESPYLADVKSQLSTIEASMADPAFYETGDYETTMERYSQLQSELARFDGQGFLDSATSVLEGLGFNNIDWDSKVKTLSGGERRKVALAKIIVASSNLDVLLLDEPTNHLDISAIEWLEDFLVSYKSTIMVVSHDRYFLDDTVNQIWEIEGKKLKGYWGDYTDFVEQKEALLNRDIKNYRNYAQQVKKQKATLLEMKRRNRFDAQIRSKLKRMEHMGKVEDPIIKEKCISVTFKNAAKGGRFIARGEEVGKSFGTKELFNDASFEVNVGETIGVIGPNGSGKTTLVKMIVGQEKPTSGELKVSKVLNVGYFDQGHLSLNEDNDLIEELLSTDKTLHEYDAKALLGRFMFKGEMVYHKIRELSGGERARLSILKLVLSPANLLVLDEPTNHLDIPSQRAIEGALNAYKGTKIIVSHDRYFLDRVADKIIHLEDKRVESFTGNYTRYREIIHKRGGPRSRSGPRWYTVTAKYTDWTTGKKYTQGERLHLHSDELDDHRWALNAHRLVPDE